MDRNAARHFVRRALVIVAAFVDEEQVTQGSTVIVPARLPPELSTVYLRLFIDATQPRGISRDDFQLTWHGSRGWEIGRRKRLRRTGDEPWR